MTPHPLSYHAERLWSNAARRDDVDHEAVRKGTTVFWIIQDRIWISLRWCAVTEYETGVIRFTNTEDPSPPKSLWPVAHGSLLTRRLEITLAADELTEDKYARIAEIFSYPDRALDWELLQQVTTDTNLWSDAAVSAERLAREKRRRQ
jgi:hypothetical protein